MRSPKNKLWLLTIIAIPFAVFILLTATQLAQSQGSIIYVDRDASGPTHDGASWTTAYTTLQDALDVATPSDEIWVAQGVYTPTAGIARTATFSLPNGVALFGGFAATETQRTQRDWAAHVTVLSGDIDGNDTTTPGGVITSTAHISGANAYHVVTAQGVTETAVIDGFTITAGQADGGYQQRYDRGGGMYNDGADPALINVTFSGNQANYYGGGMYNDSSSPTLTNVTFSGNRAENDGGGMYNNSSSPTLTDVTFSGNQADDDGGGMYNSTCRPALTNVIFSANQADNGGGMYNDYNSNSTLTNVIFSGNQADNDGGGMYNDMSYPRLTNTTFSGNQADRFGGGIRNSYSSPRLNNCILWGNSAGSYGAQMSNGAGSPVVNNSLMEGGCPSGATCYDPFLTDDPQFIAPLPASSAPTTAGDYRLQGTSPAINAGDSTAVPGSVTTDLDGKPRILGGKVDLGAYEFSGLALTKQASTLYPVAGQHITYTLIAVNAYTSTTITGAIISDTLPAGLSLAGPIVLDPSEAGTVGSAPPLLAYDLTISAGQSLAIKFPVTVAEGLPATAIITNTATITSNEVLDPVVAQQFLFLAGIIYVDIDASGAGTGLSWLDAFDNLQDALLTATSGDEIWVAQGVHYPDQGAGQTDNARASTFTLKQGVALYGGFDGTETLREQRDWATHVTVLSGDLDGNDTMTPSGVVTDTAHINGANAYHVVTAQGVTKTTVLDGFIVTAGKADGNSSQGYTRGGGIYNDGANSRLTNIIFIGNQAHSYGGGMSNGHSSPTLTDVTFSRNEANSGGGMANFGSSPTLINVTFSGNQADNDGGGIYSLSRSNPTLINVTFSGNRADEHGGGMYNNHNSPTLNNVTFSGNQANWGGGMYNTLSDPVLNNCIFWGNTAVHYGAQIYDVNSSSSVVNYSLMEGGCPSSVTCYGPVLTADPRFVDADGADNVTGTMDDNLRLLDDSPAIDAGDNTAVPADTHDLDGDGNTAEPLPYDLGNTLRFVDHPRADIGNGIPPLVDLGAHETPVVWIDKTTNAILPDPGDLLTYTITLSNDNEFAVTNVIITDVVSGDWLFVIEVISSSVAITNTGAGPTYTWQVEDLSPSQGGTITLAGVLSPNLAHGQTFTNTALIHAVLDGVARINADSAAITISASSSADERFIYLPLVLRQSP